MIFTFWEGKMPAYIDLCMKTWEFPFIVLTYDNLHQYTDLGIKKMKWLTLPQIADCVRVHVLRDNGGYWLDADTIMITDNLPEENMIGYPETRANTIGFLHAEPDSKMFEEWAEYQDRMLDRQNAPCHWSMFGNAFTDDYVKEHMDISICNVENCWPETYMIRQAVPRSEKYQRFYFGSSYTLADIRETDMLMLHNSWTPGWYKQLSEREVLEADCTLSNILRELL